MTQAITTPAPTAPAKNGKKAGGALQKMMQRATEDSSGRGGRIRRRRMCFTIDPAICEPGMYDEPFELVIESPTSEQELAAAKKHPNGGGSMIMELVRSCIVSLDGEPLKDSDLTRDSAWESFGLTGRTLIVNKFQELSGATEEILKKTHESTKLLVG